MAEYIWVDQNENELRRESKGRGRQRKNSVKRQDGNFYICEYVSYEDEKDEKDEDESSDSSDDSNEVSVPKKRHTQIYREQGKVQLSSFLKCCHVDKSDVLIEGTKITLNKPILIGETCLKYLPFNSLFSKFEIDTYENYIAVWRNPTDGPPTFRINNLFLVDIKVE